MPASLVMSSKRATLTERTDYFQICSRRLLQLCPRRRRRDMRESVGSQLKPPSSGSNNPVEVSLLKTI